MNAIQHLTKEHDEIKELFKQFEEAGERAHKKKQAIALKVIEELRMHEMEEEQIFYPAVMAASKEGAKLVLEGIEEHRVADFMVERLQATPAEDELFEARFKVLKESVEHHIKEEEKEMFPEARKSLKEDLERLAQEMEALEKQMGEQ